MAQVDEYYALDGGLDLVTPALEKAAGSVEASINYEPTARGYRRIDGIERFDGQPQPSDASFFLVNFTNGVSETSIGEVLTGDTSGASGEVLEVVVSSGSWEEGNAVGYMFIGNITNGPFQDGELLQINNATAFSDGFSSGFK